MVYSPDVKCVYPSGNLDRQDILFKDIANSFGALFGNSLLVIVIVHIGDTKSSFISISPFKVTRSSSASWSRVKRLMRIILHQAPCHVSPNIDSV